MSDTDKTPAHVCQVKVGDSPCAVRERARILAAIEAVMNVHYDKYIAGFNPYDEGAMDALDIALHEIDVEATSHE
jgi:hypothetical protein